MVRLNGNEATNDPEPFGFLHLPLRAIVAPNHISEVDPAPIFLRDSKVHADRRILSVHHHTVPVALIVAFLGRGCIGLQAGQLLTVIDILGTRPFRHRWKSTGKKKEDHFASDG
jgi:hypothetical protein